MGGSGSTYIYGYADATYKENMTKEEALQFCANCKCRIAFNCVTLHSTVSHSIELCHMILKSVT